MNQKNTSLIYLEEKVLWHLTKVWRGMSVIVSNSTLNSFPPSIPDPSYPHQRQKGLVQNFRLITNGNDKVLTRNIVPLSLYFVYQTSVTLTVYTLRILFLIFTSLWLLFDKYLTTREDLWVCIRLLKDIIKSYPSS